MSTASLMASPEKQNKTLRKKKKKDKDNGKKRLKLKPSIHPKVTTNAAKPQKPERGTDTDGKGKKRKIK